MYLMAYEISERWSAVSFLTNLPVGWRVHGTPPLRCKLAGFHFVEKINVRVQNV